MLRIAFVGKGGAGKSAIAAAFARLLARRGEPVVALDSDPMPGLSWSLGVPPDDAGLPDDTVVEQPEGDGPRWALRPGLTPEAAVDRYAAVGPDGVRLLQMGKLRGPSADRVRSLTAYRLVLRGLDDAGWHLVGDLAAGTRQVFFGWGGFARTMLVVVEPTAKALLSARRLTRLRRLEDPPTLYAVANKVREEEDVALVAQGTGLEVIGAIPYDAGLVTAEREGTSWVDVSADAPAVAAVSALVDRLAG